MCNLINFYCDYIIRIHQCLKKMVLPESLETFILTLTRKEAIQFVADCNRYKIHLYPTRTDRHRLYKLLKGKESPYELYSYGVENKNTQRRLVIKKKKMIITNEELSH